MIFLMSKSRDNHPALDFECFCKLAGFTDKIDADYFDLLQSPHHNFCVVKKPPISTCDDITILYLLWMWLREVGDAGVNNTIFTKNFLMFHSWATVVKYITNLKSNGLKPAGLSGLHYSYMQYSNGILYNLAAIQPLNRMYDFIYVPRILGTDEAMQEYFVSSILPHLNSGGKFIYSSTGQDEFFFLTYENAKDGTNNFHPYRYK